MARFSTLELIAFRRYAYEFVHLYTPIFDNYYKFVNIRNNKFDIDGQKVTNII